MVSSNRTARALLKVGAFFVVSLFVESLVFQTAFSFFAVAVVVFLMSTIKCQNCRTPIYDHRIAPYVKGFDLLVLEKCPVCSDVMLR